MTDYNILILHIWGYGYNYKIINKKHYKMFLKLPVVTKGKMFYENKINPFVGHKRKQSLRITLTLYNVQT